jgi:hypothetical protein
VLYHNYYYVFRNYIWHTCSILYKGHMCRHELKTNGVKMKIQHIAVSALFGLTSPLTAANTLLFTKRVYVSSSHILIAALSDWPI